MFVIPYQDQYTLIGTTDVPVDGLREAARSPRTRSTTCSTLANTYLAKPLPRADVVWTFTGVRPLYDDGASDPSAITRDYVFKLDTGDGAGGAPVLSIFGGKLTTYRKLAEHALAELEAVLPGDEGRAWTESDALPGGDLPPGGHRRVDRRAAARATPRCRRELRRAASPAATARARRRVLGDAQDARRPRRGLRRRPHRSARSTTCVREEWARTADDVLWRRTKCGLAMSRRRARRRRAGRAHRAG